MSAFSGQESIPLGLGLAVLATATACAPPEPGDIGTAASAETRRGTFVLDGVAVELEYQRIGGRLIFEGDIVLDPETELASSPGSATAALLVEPNRNLWPDGIVPFTIARSVSTPGRVRTAMREWEDNTAIRFVERTDEHGDAYVTFKEESGNTICQASVGYTGRRRYVYLVDTRLRSACSTSVITHEIGHTLGLWHEHTRADRDEHVRILWDNVGLRAAFTKKTTGVRLVGDYDIRSTMHYRSFTLSSPRTRPSIVRRDGSLILHDWTDLSAGDITMMARLYGPADREPPVADPVDPPPDAGVTVSFEPTSPAATAPTATRAPMSPPESRAPPGTTMTGSCAIASRAHEPSAGLALFAAGWLLVLRARRR
jgi:hypothetical protein